MLAQLFSCLFFVFLYLFFRLTARFLLIFSAAVMSFVNYTLAFLRQLRLTASALSGHAAKKEPWPEGKSEVGQSEAS